MFSPTAFFDPDLTSGIVRLLSRFHFSPPSFERADASDEVYALLVGGRRLIGCRGQSSEHEIELLV
jgi:hypothetical protein